MVFLFTDTIRGAEASANLYSLVATAKAADSEPWAYLERVLTDLRRAETIEGVQPPLPHRIQQRKDVLS